MGCQINGKGETSFLVLIPFNPPCQERERDSVKQQIDELKFQLTQAHEDLTEQRQKQLDLAKSLETKDVSSRDKSGDSTSSENYFLLLRKILRLLHIMICQMFDTFRT